MWLNMILNGWQSLDVSGARYGGRFSFVSQVLPKTKTIIQKFVIFRELFKGIIYDTYFLENDLGGMDNDSEFSQCYNPAVTAQKFSE
jgi:hypothetical protein